MSKLLYQYVLIIISLILFVYEYFPVQPNLQQDVVNPPAYLNDIKFNVSDVYKPHVDRVILVVVDALRMDFVTNENFPFVTSTFPKDGCMLDVHVQSPTVTLPRIKALTTGRVPQFLDVVLNLASTEVLKDSVLHNAKQAGKRIVFYGDDTWVKLYPNIFERYEGVSSFFVNDFTEVDNNVTRNVEKELNTKDWDLMVLHYLGLDHIGHVYGPFSHLIQNKLLEMDDIVKNIYYKTQLHEKKTMILVTGDHGMKDSGGHGGTTLEEIFVPLLILGSNCKNDSIVQTDFSATLAALMGLTLPSGNTGRINLNMFGTLSHERALYILNYGASSLKSQTSDYEDIYEEASRVYYKFLRTREETLAKKAKSLYQRYLHRASKSLVQSYLNQNDKTLLVCIVVMLNYLLDFFYNYLNSNSNLRVKELIVITTILILQHILPSNPEVSITFLIILCCLTLHYLILISKNLEWRGCDISTFIIFLTILYLISLQSSSFIEEEHQLWYFFFGACVLILSYYERNLFNFAQVISIFVFLRIFRTLNPAGNKWSHLPTLSQWLLLDENTVYLYVLLCISMVLMYASCYFLINRHSILSVIIIILIFLFHTWIFRNSLLGKLIWFLIALNFVFGLSYPKSLLENIIIAWLLYSGLLIRSYNIILLPICVWTCLIIKKYVKNVTILTGLYIWIGRTFFFLQGHSNSLASIDVASGYVGVESYVPVIVIFQTICHTYAFPVLTILLALHEQLLYSDMIWKCSIIHRILPLIFTCIIVFVQKHHLFVWSVFAPKLLIEFCHSIILLIQLFVFSVTKCIDTSLNKV